MTTSEQFLALNPVEGVKYSASVLSAYKRLDESKTERGQCSSGGWLWLEKGRVFRNDGVVVDNTYYGERTQPQQLP